MTILFYIFLTIIGIALLILVTGLMLPAERVVSRKGEFNIPPHELYNIVTNNHDWQYRSGLKDLVIIENKNGIEIWDEIALDGSSIRFTTQEKNPYTFYSFNMESALFTGYWTGEFEPDGKNGTIFTATEHIRVKNPFIKTLSYIFFDIGKFMDSYQNDLKQKTESIRSNKPILP